MRSFLAGLFASLMLTVAAYPFGLPMLKALNLSPRLAEAARATGCTAPSYASVGYREPSLVFLTDTEIPDDRWARRCCLPRQGGPGLPHRLCRAPGGRGVPGALQGNTAPALVTRVRGVNINAALDKQRRLRILDIAVMSALIAETERPPWPNPN